MKIEFSVAQVDQLCCELQRLKKYVQDDLDSFQYMYGYFYDIDPEEKKYELKESVKVANGFIEQLKGALDEYNKVYLSDKLK